ncbi:MAG TPA: FABP family protein [Nakamurella sp.]|nr:FABP family protein [Nakamurella sp.]
MTVSGDDTRPPDGTARASGDEAVAAAARRARGTRDVNIESVPPLPIPADTANVRLGPEINQACLSLLPLVGVWRGTGMFGNDPTDGPAQFGQQIVVSHDGRPFLRYESVMWLLSPEGRVNGPGSRELGWFRPQPDGSVELLVAHAEGRIEVFYGRARSVASWALSTDGIWRTPSAPPVIGATRLYGITADGRLAYVEERAHEDIDLAPHASAALERIAG